MIEASDQTLSLGHPNSWVLTDSRQFSKSLLLLIEASHWWFVEPDQIFTMYAAHLRGSISFVVHVNRI